MENNEIKEVIWPITLSPVPEDKSLASILEDLRKDELEQIRTLLEIKRASRLKKGELIERIVQELPEKLENILDLLDEERLDIVEKLRRNKGIISARRIPYHKAIYFVFMCIAYPGLLDGKRVLFMPEEVKDFFYGYPLKPLREKAKKNTEIITLTIEMLNYYGVLSFETLQELLEKYIEVPVSGKELLEILFNAAHYHDRLDYQEGFFTDSGVMNPGYIWLEQQKRSEIDYYPFSFEELWKASEIDYIDLNPQAEKFLDHLKSRLGLSHEEAIDLYHHFNFEILNDIPFNQVQQEVVFDRINFNSFEEAKEFMPVMMEMYNHMRQWILKGHSPQEIFEKKEKPKLKPLPQERFVFPKDKKKVGRNDPCPCGSGKKYKKCCLNN